MAGYDHYSKSNNALQAESENRYPITKAKAVVAQETGVSQLLAGRALKAWHNGEFHHTSKHYNSTNYYDIAFAIAALNAGRQLGLTLDAAFFGKIDAYTSCDIDELQPEVLDNSAEFIRDVNALRNERIKDGIEYARGILKIDPPETARDWIANQAKRHLGTLEGLRWDAALQEITKLIEQE